MKQEQNRGRVGTSGHNKEQSNTSKRHVIQGVNFEEMNYEQRRAPYNSVSKSQSQREYVVSRSELRSDQKPIDR